jgi:hypothetical protein
MAWISSRPPRNGSGSQVNLPQRFDQARCALVQFANMVKGKASENFSAFCCNAQYCPALVVVIHPPNKQPFAFAAINKFNSAVVLEAETVSRIRDCDFNVRGRAGNLQEELMLLRLKARFCCRKLAEVQEMAQFVPEVGQGSEQQWIGDTVFAFLHIYIVSRYIVPC